MPARSRIRVSTHPARHALLLAIGRAERSVARVARRSGRSRTVDVTGPTRGHTGAKRGALGCRVGTMGLLGRITVSSSQFANKRGVYAGRRSTKIHVALYRRSRGRIGGHLPGLPGARVLLLDHTGANSGIGEPRR